MIFFICHPYPPLNSARSIRPWQVIPSSNVARSISNRIQFGSCFWFLVPTLHHSILYIRYSTFKMHFLLCSLPHILFTLRPVLHALCIFLLNLNLSLNLNLCFYSNRILKFFILNPTKNRIIRNKINVSFQM